VVEVVEAEAEAAVAPREWVVAEEAVAVAPTERAEAAAVEAVVVAAAG
jgi:hypothetical protein